MNSLTRRVLYILISALGVSIGSPAVTFAEIKLVKVPGWSAKAVVDGQGLFFRAPRPGDGGYFVSWNDTLVEVCSPNQAAPIAEHPFTPGLDKIHTAAVGDFGPTGELAFAALICNYRNFPADTSRDPGDPSAGVSEYRILVYDLQGQLPIDSHTCVVQWDPSHVSYHQWPYPLGLYCLD
ncbi:MAG TPA: hypothetical protein VLB27_09530, partial [candidate division Zixibacteria bacterium]|nr:hypothetical protein [candidate division Zixibacteria bacterium]